MKFDCDVRVECGFSECDVLGELEISVDVEVELEFLALVFCAFVHSIVVQCHLAAFVLHVSHSLSESHSLLHSSCCSWWCPHLLGPAPCH